VTTGPDKESQQAGIVISGGTVHIGALAQGPRARASQVVQAAEDQLAAERRDQLTVLVAELLSVLRQHQPELADGAKAQAAAEEAATELAADEPDTSRARRLLDKVTAAAGPVAEIAAAVNAVQRAITGAW
jgi:hypothetical protein